MNNHKDRPKWTKMGSIINKMMFTPHPTYYTKSLSHLIFITRGDNNEIEIPVRYLHLDDNYETIMMCHGNAEDIGDFNIEYYANEIGANICIFDYAGYGLHSLSYCSEEETQKDALAVYDYIRPTILCGRSIGTGVACYLAKIKQPKKLILISPFLSIVKLFMDTVITWDYFENYKLLPNIDSVTLIIHGEDDKIIPLYHSTMLSQLCNNLYDFVIIPYTGHNDISRKTICKTIKEFL